MASVTQAPTTLVVTTISAPNIVLRELAAGCAQAGWRFVVAGDAKSPADFVLEGCEYLSLEAQGTSGFAYAGAAPVGHYARKNIGYLQAIRGGARVIVETDDDNHPLPAFFQPMPEQVEALAVEQAGWANIYAYYSDQPVWPRGFPLQEVRRAPPELPAAATQVLAPIQQALANDNPDVDAVFRLTRDLPLRFHPDARRVALGRGSWCPYNSQATVHHARAFPLLYLPAHCSFRMTDIWRSFVAQRIGWACGWHLLFREATVRQERNEHDLMRDFAEEVPGYLNNAAIARLLEALPLANGEAAIPDNLRACYRALVAAGHVGEAELPLLEAWLDDLAQLNT